ncbi:hypothetical protein F7R91_03425 [Streptomyces luteolifulvus]|uniref:SWIM-type domain-containing protein n=1 Tax=Streptomyces luteolifulvus TaxID=2615112 RepID=A0A6H9V9D8_9ACTN|nr:hypothetical protein F7R91_03425 [Streptomyces luteolifulvus]
MTEPVGVPPVSAPAQDSAGERHVKPGEGRTARPGDVAREALRQALSARREAASGADAAADSALDASGGVSSAGGDRPDDAAESAPATPGAETARRGGRPADLVREALRAARGGADAGAEAAPKAPRPEPDPAAARARSRTRGRVTDIRTHAVRELLGDAFRMPDLAAEPEEEHRTGALSGNSARQADDGSSPARAPAAPRVPRSMAAPGRDTELRRTFPAFPPRPSDDARFAETWWGNAWLTALEEGALDAKRLARGRGYAQQGHVDAIMVTPGLVLAYVRGSRPRPYRVQVRLRTLDDTDWERFLDAAAERPGHIAALLDKEMPETLADCGVPLLPGPGELEPRCSCPDFGHPCKHAAALCYQTARLLDADPFVLLLLRGRGERDLLDALSRRNAARAARAAQEREPAPLPGVRATDALAPRRLPPLPAPLPLPPHPEQPPVYPAAPGGPDPFALDQLATDAAARAHALLATGRDPVAELTLWQDAVRLAAARPGSGLTAGTRALYSSLASAAGRTPAELARAVAAWRQGGLEGLTVLDEPWDPPAGRFDRARPLLLAADLPAFRPWRNHLTHPNGQVQLRFGRDGLWYAYESEPTRDDWWPRGTPDLDPVGALTGLGTPLPDLDAPSNP